VSTTPEGAKLFQQVSDEVGKMTACMWDGLDSSDLATAALVLTTITEGANRLSSRAREHLSTASLPDDTSKH
jgi:hypothetical protein